MVIILDVDLERLTPLIVTTCDDGEEAVAAGAVCSVRMFSAAEVDAPAVRQGVRTICAFLRAIDQQHPGRSEARSLTAEQAQTPLAVLERLSQ